MMVTFYTDIMEAFIPVLIVLIPAIMTFSVLQTKISFVVGAMIGACAGNVAYGDLQLIPDWALVMGIILIAAMLFIDSDTIGS